MIYGEMTEKVKKHTTKTLIHRQTKTTDFDNFNKDLLDAPWHVGEIFDDLDDAYDYWRNLFDSIANEHAPIRKKRVRERDVCFMSKEWKTAIRNKRKYAIQFAKDRTAENFELKKKYRNIATREQRKALTAYWYKKSEEMKSKPHDFFNTFRPFLNNKTKDANPIFLKNKHEDGIIEDQRQVAETLTNYFSTIASDIGGNHVISLTDNEFNNHSSVQMIETIHSNSSFQFKHINTKDVHDLFENLNPRKSCSDTGLMPKLMKKVAEGIAPSVTNLYNRCIENSNWPAIWKRGELTPISRKGTSIM